VKFAYCKICPDPCESNPGRNGDGQVGNEPYPNVSALMQEASVAIESKWNPMMVYAIDEPVRTGKIEVVDYGE
jgi:hypothetical protein